MQLLFHSTEVDFGALWSKQKNIRSSVCQMACPLLKGRQILYTVEAVSAGRPQ